MKFSERNGYRAPRLEYQGEAMDEPLRNDLWNTIYSWYFRPNSNPKVAQQVWRGYLVQPVDLFRMDNAQKMVRGQMIGGEWLEAYDAVEYIASLAHGMASAHRPGDLFYDRDAAAFLKAINETLDRHMAGWHILGGQVAPVTSTREIESVDDALTAAVAVSAGAEHHLRAAVSALSDRSDPDYANSIRESYLAVEGVAKAIIGDPNATLGQALKAISRRTSAIDAGVLVGWSAMYGRASDVDGLRHAGALAPVFAAADARYMLVTASAFINLLLTYDTHNAAVDYVPESEVPAWERPSFEASTPDTETTVTA